MDILNSVNIRSANANFDHLLLSFENDVMFKYLDVIILTETWHDTNNCNFNINGFQLFHSKVKRNQNDGIIIFIKDNFSVDFKEYDCNEGNIVNLTLSDMSCNERFNILCIYRSPSSNSDEFLTCLSNIIKTDKTLIDRTLIIGDTNINIIGTDNIDNEYLDLLSSYGFHSFVNIYTRLPTTHTHSCIDHVFVKCNDDNILNNIQASVLQMYITDHCPVITSVPLLKYKSHTDNNYKNIVDYKLVKNKLKNETWTSVNDYDINKSVKNFYDIIFNAINSCTNKKVFHSKNKRIKEWMTAGLLRSTRRKNELSIKVKKHPLNQSLVTYFKSYRNKLNSLIKIAKIHFYKNKFISVSKNPKATWKLINEITGKKLTNNDNINSIKVNEEQINCRSEPIKACNAFNKFFSEVGLNLSKTFNTVNMIAPVPLDKHFDDIFTKDVDKKEVLHLFNLQKEETAAGFDKISVKLIKIILPLIIDPLITIYNKSLKEGIFPTQFKVAIVKPIFKKGNRQYLGNYRPISIITIFAKVLEKIVKNRLITFLEENNLLSKNQFGFRKGLGTIDALYKVSKYIYNALDNNQKAIAVFLDFAKAFDTVDHRQLLIALPGFGIVNESLKWFTSYLKSRVQYVALNDYMSDETYINCGVPQGSVLGPVLFIMYINSLCNMKINGSIVTYADDTCLLFTDATWDLVYNKAETELNKFIQYLNLKKISVNYDKTVFIAFSIYNCTQFSNQELIIYNDSHKTRGSNDYKINRVTKARYLGLMLDCNFRWNIHVQNINMRLRTVIYKLYSLNKTLSLDTMKIVYLSLYQSILQYGITIWGGASDKTLKPIISLQNRAVRISLNKTDRVGSSNENYKELGVLPLNLLYKKYSISFTLKNHSKFDPYINKRETLKYNLNVNYSNKCIGQKFVDYLGPTYFNYLEINVKRYLRLSNNNNINKYLTNVFINNL